MQSTLCGWVVGFPAGCWAPVWHPACSGLLVACCSRPALATSNLCLRQLPFTEPCTLLYAWPMQLTFQDRMSEHCRGVRGDGYDLRQRWEAPLQDSATREDFMAACRCVARCAAAPRCVGSRGLS